MDIDRDRLLARLEKYFDPTLSDEEMRRLAPSSLEPTNGFQAQNARAYLLKRGLRMNGFVRYAYRPFDVRWLYWEPETKLLDRSREEYEAHVSVARHTLVTQQKPRREWSAPQIIEHIGCLDLMDRGASCFPMYLNKSGRANLALPGFQLDSLAGEGSIAPNLSAEGLAYLPGTNEEPSSESLFLHAVAILHSPSYARENGGALRQDWPRVPLPASSETLSSSADIGQALSALLNSDTAVVGVTQEALRQELSGIGVVTSIEGRALNPGAGDLAVTAGWGYAGQGGITMPGQGKVLERAYTDAEREAIRHGGAGLGLADEEMFACLGDATFDVYLNEIAFWKNIPAAVWEYTIGGYQVLKKWLSYRESRLLGRPLSECEVRDFTGIARRIAAILLVGPALQKSYEAVKSETYLWPCVTG